MMRRVLISVCTGALILVFAGLIIGDKLDLVSGVEFSEDALRQGLHRTISPQTAPLADIMNLAQRQATIAAIRSSTCADDQHYVSPFEGSNRRGDVGRVETGVADVLSGRWTLDSQKIDIARRDDPIYLASLSRGARYAVHAHQFLDKVMVLITLKHEDASEKRRLLLYSAQALADYANGHFFTNNDYRTDQSGEFSWYDMGAGQRASLLGFAVSHATCESGIPDEVIETLIRFAADHLYYLSTDTYFVSHNNHGIYQSIGLITLCKYVRVLKGCGIATELSLNRLQAMLDDDFVKGFHKEHSPAYHKDMLKALSGLSSLLPQEHPLAERLIDLHGDVYANLAWFVRPDRSLVQFGDTNYYTLSPLLEDSSDDAMPAALRWLLSDGGEGWAQGSALLDDTAAGYGIVRHIQAGGRPSEASYLALSAGFHSRTHKHADDLTFVWSEGQHNILIDSGRYSYARKAPPTPEMNSMGFWYDDPKRMYVESTHAHNTIEMDGAPIPRTDDGAYGSGVDTGFEAGTGLYVLQAAVTREDGGISSARSCPGRFRRPARSRLDSWRRWRRPRLHSVVSFRTRIRAH